MIESVYSFDFALLDWIQTHLRCAFLDTVMPLITRLGDAGIFFILCAAVMLVFKKTRKTGLSVAFALLLGLLICNLTIKPLVGRIRPYDLREIALLIPRETDSGSFPSGHTIAAFEFATALTVRKPKWGVGAIVLAVVIAFSRLYLYVHYPTDVFTSVLLGIMLGLVGVVLADLVYKAAEKRRETAN